MIIERGRKFAFSKVFFAVVLLVLLIGVVSNPSLSLQSASDGLSIWFNVIIPSLFPFFIISELLIDLGFVQILGHLLSPLMGPLFAVSGQGAFPLTMGMVSGYPVGAKLSSSLRLKGEISLNEANRLICFTSTSGPSFMLGAVSIGMLANPSLAPLILLPHYLSVLIIGLLMPFIIKGGQSRRTFRKKASFKGIKRVSLDFLTIKKPIGPLISRAIKESLDTIMLIGGLVIFYSVLVEILFSTKLIQGFIYFLGSSLKVDSSIIKGILVGFFEVTIGCKSIALSTSTIVTKLVLINLIIGWSGLSVHSQVLNFLGKTDLNSRLYILSKFIHGLISAFLSYVLYNFKYKDLLIESFSKTTLNYTINQGYSFFHMLYLSTRMVVMINLSLLTFAIVSYLIFLLKNALFN